MFLFDVFTTEMSCLNPRRTHGILKAEVILALVGLRTMSLCSQAYRTYPKELGRSSSPREESLRGRLTDQFQIFQQLLSVLLIHAFDEHGIHGFAKDATSHLILHLRR